MLMHRRGFLLAAGSIGLLTACQSGPPAPSAVTVVAVGTAGMNLSPEGAERPVTIMVMRLRGLGAFNAADLFALQADPSAVLAGDLIGVDQLAVAPGSRAEKTITFEPEAAYIGVVALLRDPTGRNWRASAPIAKESTVTIAATLGPGGVSLGSG
jgi:type VI secretion system protein VasD